jgi:hypothetical protein
VFEDLDELARGLAENDLSRRQAIKWAGYSVLGAALSSMGFAERAEALTPRQRRTCLERGGTVCGRPPLANKYCCARGKTCAGQKTCVNKGCRLGGTCTTGFNRGCRNNRDCFCTATQEGNTFCTRSIVCATATTCTNTQDCPAGHVCARTCCGQAVKICNPPCPRALRAGASEASSAAKEGMSGR